MSDSTIPGSPGSGAVLAGDAAPKPDKAAADDAPVDTEADRRGDGFARVLKSFGPLIRRIVNGYSENVDDQEDMYQEASIRLLTRAKNYREQGTRQGWVVTLTRGVCRDWRTTKAKYTSAIDRYSAQVPPVEEPTPCSTIPPDSFDTGPSSNDWIAPWPRFPLARPRRGVWSTSRATA